MLEMETAFLPLSALESSPGTGGARAVPLCSVTQHKAQVLEVRFWCSDLNFNVSVPSSCQVLSPGRALTAVGFVEPFQKYSQPTCHGKALSPDWVCRELLVPGRKPRLRSEHL